MTIPSYRGVATASGSSNSATVDLSTIDGGSPPSDGDLLLAHVARNQTPAVDTNRTLSPTGWHRLGTSKNTLTSAFYWKIREAGDSNSVTFNWAGTSTYIAAIHCIRGADQSRPICRHSTDRTSSATWAWLAETTPVADCLAIATAVCGHNRSGTTPASGWTERVDLETGTLLGMYCQTQGFTSASTSTGTASTTIGGSGSETLDLHMLLIQPSQTATPKDVRVATGSLTSPTSTGNQDITGLGFDCKALIVYGMRQNTDAVSANVEHMHGIGADDGVTSAAQRCAGVARVGAAATGEGWSRNGEIVCMFFAGNTSSPDLLATYSRITNGFRLNWATVQATGYDFNYIALGGSDLQAVCGAKTADSSPLTTLPWRPDLIHALSQALNSDSDQVRSGSLLGQLSIGWLDTNAGAQWNSTAELQTVSAIRDNAFFSKQTSGALGYDLQFSQATSTGFSWQGSGSEYFFYLALNWGATHFPVQVESPRASDGGGVAGADQIVPSFGMGQTYATKKLTVSMLSRSSYQIGGGASTLSEGHASFRYSPVDQDVFAYGSTGERRRKPNDSLLFGTLGDLDALGKVGAWTDQSTVDWSTNDVVEVTWGLFTLGFIGQEYALTLTADSPAVSDAATRATVSVRTTSDVAVVTDSIQVTRVLGRVVNDTTVVTDSIQTTRVLGRVVSDTVVVSDTLTRATSSVRATNDTATVTDALTRTATYARAISDTTIVVDVLTRTATYGRTTSETAVVTDSLSRTATYARVISDTAVVTDSIQTTRVADRVISDTAIVSDTLVRAVSSVRATSDTIAVADTLAASASAYGRTTSDTVSAVDALSRTATFNRAIADAHAISDALRVTSEKAFSDSVAVAELVRVARSISIAITDAVALDEALVGSVDVIVADSATVTDTVRTARVIAIVVVDATSLTDSLSVARVFGAAVSDTIATTDTLAVARVVARSVIDVVSVVDVVARAHAATRAIADALAVTDQIALGATKQSEVSDSVLVSDAVATAFGYARRAIDVVLVADTSAREHDARRTVVDTISVVDAVAVGAATVVETGDVVSALDAVALQVAFARLASDAVATGDQVVATVIGVGVKISDSVATADTIARAFAYGRRSVDAISTTDSLGLEQIGVALDLVDVVDVADSVTISVGIGKLLSDQLVVVESFSSLRTLGGSASDTLAITDSVLIEILKIGTDAVTTIDALRVATWYSRATVDAVNTEDLTIEGEDDLVFVPYGVDANVGPIVMFTIGDSGPISISGGPDLSTGPVGFVTRKGDFVSITDQMIQGMSLAVEFVDSVEATG